MDERQTNSEPDGVDRAAVTSWLQSRVPRLDPPLSFDQIEGGRSNLTYHVRDDGGHRWVLRRPPLHGVLESAHDMGREHRIMAALQDSAVPVPPLVGFEPDDDIIGSPFYVMEHVAGPVVRDATIARSELDEDARARAADNLVDVLVDLHAVDVDAVGLGDLARKEDYIARQLRRWHGQFDQGKTRDLPLIDDLHQRLSSAIPEQGPATIVHGDYRLDNLIVGTDGTVRAVLDWELCTLGDPLADVGLLMVYWGQEGDEVMPLLDPPTVVEGFPTREQVAARYAERSGRDLSQLDFYIAFGYWKLAIILEGVYARFSTGAYGESEDDTFRQFGRIVEELADGADAAAQRLGL